MSPTLSTELFKSWVDFEAASQRVTQRLNTLREPRQLMRFFLNYASWNGHFANGVSSLSCLIGAQRDLFLEPGFARAVADRSNFVASHFFQAAVDEYDDHINPARDTHRCLAQACMLGMCEFLELGDAILNETESTALLAINGSVARNYAGLAAPERSLLEQVFWGMGYHLGSELLADQEFSLIDEHLRLKHADMAQHLMRTTKTLGGGTHRCYAWIGVHSGHGGGVEADHFDYAIEGATAALKFLAARSHEVALAQIKSGFLAFAADHQRFFALE